MRIIFVFVCTLLFLCSASALAQETAEEPASTTAPIDVNVVNTPNVNVVNKVEIEDDGSSQIPVVTEPELEGLPDILQVFDSLKSWRNSFSSVVLPDHSSRCPMPVVTVFDRVITLDAHCRIFGEVSSMLAGACLFFYSTFALVITLRA